MPVPGGPKQNEPYWIALRSRILQGDRVNEMKLAEIELDQDARTTSNAYFLAGVTEMQAGNSEKPAPISKMVCGPRRNSRTCWNGTPSRFPRRVSMTKRSTNWNTRSR